MDQVEGGKIASRLLDLMPILIRVVRREVNMDEAAGLTFPQFRILCHLGEDVTTNKALAESTGVSVAATSRMVDGLVSKGLVERRRDAKDKRLCHLGLSDLGHSQALDFRGHAQEQLGQHLSKLDAEEATQVLQAVDLLLRAFHPAHRL